MTAISYKVFWSAMGSLLSAATAVLSAALQVSLLVSIPVTVAAAAAFVVAAAKVVRFGQMFAQLRDDARRQITRWIGVAAGAYSLWAVAAQLRPDLWPGLTLTLVLLGFAVYGGARWNEYLLTQLRPAEARRGIVAAAGELTADKEPQPGDANAERKVKLALERSNYSWLTVVSVEQLIERSAAFGVRVMVQVPSWKALTDDTATSKGTGKKAGTSLTGPASVEAIAIALREVLGIRIATNWVTITKLQDAGLYQITATFQDMMARVFPFVDDLTWTSVETPALIGFGEDLQEYYNRLDQMGQYTGQTLSGKTSLINNHWAHLLRCRDAVVFVAGVEKVYETMSGWLEPYKDKDVPHRFGWIVNGMDDLLDMLVGLMTLARWRQSRPLAERRKRKTIVLYIDEAAFALQDNRVGYYRNNPHTASQLVAMLRRGAGSARIFIKLINQRSTIPNWGSAGGDIIANAAEVCAFMSQDWHEIGRTMHDFRATQPTHKGEYQCKPGDGRPVVRLKAPYIQEDDPQRDVLYDDGPLVSDVSWARRMFHHELDAEEQAILASVSRYKQRHTHMSDRFYSYLAAEDEFLVAEPAGGAATASAPRSAAGGTVQAAVASALEDVRRIVAGEGATAAPVGTAVATLEGHKPRHLRIHAILAAADRPLSVDEIEAGLRAAGDTTVTTQLVRNGLARLKNDDQADNAERGLYVAL